MPRIMMNWVEKAKSITPIPSSVERKLLQIAYDKQPNNERFFNKLIEAHLHENHLDNAIKLCEKHLKHVAKNDYAFAAIIQVYRKLGDIENVIQVGQLATNYHPTLNTRLSLADAYTRKHLFNLAKELMPSPDEYASMNITNLRLTLQIYLRIEQPQDVYLLYYALPISTQSDSGLTSSLIQALPKLGKQSELTRRLDHSSMVRQYHLDISNKNETMQVVHKTLASFLSSHEKQVFEPGKHTAKLGSQMHFEASWHSHLIDLETQIKFTVERYLNESPIIHTESNQTFSLNLWANILDKGGHQISHMHPDALLSGVYYIKVPNSINSAENGEDAQGCLLFSQIEKKPYYVRPSEGLLVLFPSYFYHETIPLRYQETRICIAFDVVIVSTD